MTNRYTVHFHGSYLLYAVSLFLACLMVLQSNRVKEMQVELRELRQWTSLVCGNIKESSTDISRCGISDSHRHTQWNGIRGKREISRHGRRRQRRTGQSLPTRTHIHTIYLIIYNFHVIQQGVVPFFILFLCHHTHMVLYKDTTWTMGHVIKKRLHGIETILMKCIQSMPSNITVAQNTCYTAGVHYLEPGSTLELSIPRKSAGLVLKPHSTFLGMFRI
ncbi:tumor necrosis factor ligand superfamily member 13 isoform X3 [Oncorhynchus keta]|uniref:tumor necrosis factor ligand superfamily member 13 isoform X3 n=1 Tax=Oncorhynchus keta TaxID=8018 RepID=UPI0015FD7E5C|nr:tumor necrosis factor ligand superfamily member 13 isoform X3 [Oncorhynchus keta]